MFRASSQKSADKGSLSELPLDNETVRLMNKKRSMQELWERKEGTVKVDIGQMYGLTIASEDVSSVYEIDKHQIGAGQFGVVRKCRMKGTIDKKFAIKSLEKAKLKGDVTSLRTELKILRFCDHPNVVKFVELYQDPVHYHFILELCRGGDLGTWVKNHGPLSEEETKAAIYQVLKSLAYLHACGLMHRDVKCENFLFLHKSATSPVKLIDFGLSTKMHEREKMYSIVGTPTYIAPEMIEKIGYDEKIDVWAVGVMTYFLLTGLYPFMGDTHQTLFLNIKNNNYNMKSVEQFKRVSPMCKEFIASIFQRNPKNRPTAHEALRNVWFQDLNAKLDVAGHKLINKPLLQRMKGNRVPSVFFKEVVSLIVKLFDDRTELKDAQNIFFSFDLLNNGIISALEVREVFRDHGEALSEREAEDIVSNMCVRNRHVASYSEFMASVTDHGWFLQEEVMKLIFKKFDVDGDGYISKRDIQMSFARSGVELSKEELARMTAEFSLEKDGDVKVSQMEFNLLLAGFDKKKPEEMTAPG